MLADLYKFAVLWNTHKIRKQNKNVELIAGKPDVLYFAAESVGKVNYASNVDIDDLDTCLQQYNHISEFSQLGCTGDFAEIVFIIQGGKHSSPQDTSEGLQLYRKLIADINRYEFLL